MGQEFSMTATEAATPPVPDATQEALLRLLLPGRELNAESRKELAESLRSVAAQLEAQDRSHSETVLPTEDQATGAAPVAPSHAPSAMDPQPPTLPATSAANENPQPTDQKPEASKGKKECQFFMPRRDGQSSYYANGNKDGPKKEDIESGGKGKGKGGRNKTREEVLIDMKNYKQRYVAFEVAYFGWDYFGFAAQESSEDTVEERLFAALRGARLIDCDKEHWAELGYSRCGRTDKGVSALGQVITLKVRSRAKAHEEHLPPEDQELDYISTLNKHLPDDIRVTGWATVPEGFSARFSAQWRHYKYFFMTSDEEEGKLDLQAMQDAAQAFVGAHDFRNLCKMDPVNVHSFTRRILSCTVSRAQGWGRPGLPVYVLDVQGTAFLWHQVRNMAAVLLFVGRGYEGGDLIPHLLDPTACPRKPQFQMAPADALVLHHCSFAPDLRFHRLPVNDDQLTRHLQDMIRKATIKLALMRLLMTRLQCPPTHAEPHHHGPPGDVSPYERWAEGIYHPSKAPPEDLDETASADEGLPREWRGKREARRVVKVRLRPDMGRTHLPLRRRPTEETYEERSDKVHQRRREKEAALAARMEKQAREGGAQVTKPFVSGLNHPPAEGAVACDDE